MIRKFSVAGVLVDEVNYEGALERIGSAAMSRSPFSVTALAVHGVMTGVDDPVHRYRLNRFDLVAPDGQPVRWALRLIHGVKLADRVYGPTLTLEVAGWAAREGLPVYFYGSTPEVLSALKISLLSRFPDLKIAGLKPSQFRIGTITDLQIQADEIMESGARVLFVGLGCPRQEVFTFHIRDLVSMPVLAVGAAFDYHAGLLRKPPAAMQRWGLEWLWRLCLEPRRLWRRYLVLNPRYVLAIARQKAAGANSTAECRPADSPAIPL